MTKRVLISNKDGEEYSVTEADFRKHYADLGFTVRSYEDGSEYEGDKRTATKEKGEDE